MKSKTKEQQESHENAKICYICKEHIENKDCKDNKYCKVRSNCHYAGEHRKDAHSICNLKYGVPKKGFIAFHDRSNYDYFLS